MKIFLIREGEPKTTLRLPFSGCPHVVLDAPCPACGAEHPEGTQVQGGDAVPSEDDRAYEAVAMAVCCRGRVGILRVEMETLFGVREDEAVLNSRARVY